MKKQNGEIGYFIFFAGAAGRLGPRLVENPNTANEIQVAVAYVIGVLKGNGIIGTAGKTYREVERL